MNLKFTVINKLPLYDHTKCVKDLQALPCSAPYDPLNLFALQRIAAAHRHC